MFAGQQVASDLPTFSHHKFGGCVFINIFVSPIFCHVWYMLTIEFLVAIKRWWLNFQTTHTINFTNKCSIKSFLFVKIKLVVFRWSGCNAFPIKSIVLIRFCLTTLSCGQYHMRWWLKWHVMFTIVHTLTLAKCGLMLRKMLTSTLDVIKLTQDTFVIVAHHSNHDSKRYSK